MKTSAARFWVGPGGWSLLFGGPGLSQAAEVGFMMQEWSQVGGTAVRLEGHEEKWAPFICVGVCVGSFGLFCNSPNTAYVTGFMAPVFLVLFTFGWSF